MAERVGMETLVESLDYVPYCWKRCLSDSTQTSARERLDSTIMSESLAVVYFRLQNRYIIMFFFLSV